MNGRVEPRRSTQISTQDLGLTMAYAERRERQKGVRYRGIYKASDGRYRSAGTFSTEERALEVAKEAERRAAEVFRGAAGGWTLVSARPGQSRSTRRCSFDTTGSKETLRTPMRTRCACM